MARLRIREVKKGDTTFAFLAGEVVKVSGKDGVVKNVTLRGTRFDRKSGKNVPTQTTVAFWNSNDTDKKLEGKGQYADRIAAAKVREGVFLLVLAIKREDGTLSGVDFKYSGRITVRGGDEYTKSDGSKGVTKDTNVILGYISNAKLDKVTMKDEEVSVAHLTVPLTGRDGETEFHNISIISNEDRPEAAENAYRLLHPYTKKGEEKKTCQRAILICGEDTHFGEDDETKHSYNCYRFEFAPKGNGNSQAPDSGNSGNGNGDAANQQNTDKTPAENDEFENVPDDISGDLPFDDNEDDDYEEALPWA